jgi:hypothetical protein
MARFISPNLAFLVFFAAVSAAATGSAKWGGFASPRIIDCRGNDWLFLLDWKPGALQLAWRYFLKVACGFAVYNSHRPEQVSCDVE